MTEPTISCPKCKTEIKLTESLAAPLIQATRREYERKIKQKEDEINEREAALRKDRIALSKAKESIDQQVATRLRAERQKIADEEQKKARRLLAADLEKQALELSDLRQMIQDREAKLAEAQKAQADTLRKQRELDDARRELDLTVEKRVQESLSAVRKEAKQEAEDGLKLQVRERDEQISSMQRQIDELKRKSEQGSQQLQGEVFELELESQLRNKFPADEIEPVPRGEFGGDLLHRVNGPSGQYSGPNVKSTSRAS
jgi:hypothetical protein